MASSSQSTGRGASPGIHFSFYGSDLGPTFLSHLRSSLSEDCIRTYLEFDAALHMEEDATSSRFKASKFAIVIFSKNYASLSGFLNELRKIMEHRKHGKLEVLPIFYRADPTDVRMPKKSFKRVLVIHENKFGKDSAKVKRWRKALSEAGSLSGCWFKNHESEAELIKSVVGHIHYLIEVEERWEAEKSTYAGRSLCSKSSSEWVEKLQQDPSQDIISILKISYDGLDKDGQEIFLDITCFFKGWDKDLVVKIFAGCGFKTTMLRLSYVW